MRVLYSHGECDCKVCSRDLNNSKVFFVIGYLTGNLCSNVESRRRCLNVVNVQNSNTKYSMYSGLYLTSSISSVWKNITNLGELQHKTLSMCTMWYVTTAFVGAKGTGVFINKEK